MKTNEDFTKRISILFGSIFFMLLINATVKAQTPRAITAVNVAVTENFDSLGTTGGSKDASGNILANGTTIVVPGFSFSETGSNANTAYSAGTGSSSTADTYNFGTSGAPTDRALGELTNSTLNSTIGAAFTNNTGTTITKITISFRGEQYRVGDNLTVLDRLDFQYSVDQSATLTTGTYNDFNALDFTSPNPSSPAGGGGSGLVDGNASGNFTVLTATITGLSLAPNQVFRIRFLATDISGADDGLAIDDFSLQIAGTTAVQLSSFTSAYANGGVILEWQTGFEVDNLGFNLYRERNGKRTRVNPSLIAGSAFLAAPGTALTAGDSYSWLDPSGTPDSVYYLEDIDLNGTRTLHGPIVPTASSSISSPPRQSMLLSELNAQAESTSNISKWQKGWPAYTGAGRELLYDIDDKPGADLPSLIAAHGAVKLSVNKEGWYQVTQADLVTAGFNKNVDARMLQLYVGGAQVPIRMNATKQQFSAGDSFEFYGTGLDTPTTDTNTYWLVVGNGKGLRISPASRTSTSAQTDSSSNERPSTSQSQNGTGQSVQAAPSPASPRQASAPQVRPGWFIMPTIIPSTPKEDVVKPESDDNVAPAKATPTNAPSRNNSEKASTPAKKSKKTKARTKKARLKASSRSHAMLRPAIVQSYPYTVELKERLIYTSSLLNGERENFFGQVVGSAAANQHLFLQNLNQGANGTAKLEIALQGYTLVSHQVKVKVNGQEISAFSFSNQENPVTQLSIPYSVLREGDNTVTLERAGGDSDFSLVDYIRLTYEHSYRADDNLVKFSAEGSTRLDGFTNGNIRVIDVTDPLRVKELNSAVESTSQGYAATIQAPREGEYLAFTDDQMLRPAAIELDKPSNLKSNDNGADMVIISYGDFAGSVQPLAEQRRKEGLAVSVVEVQDVFDEFSGGAHTPYAIKDFLSWAKSHWQKSPRFVLLVGDAGIDPRNYQGNGLTDFVPTKLIDASTMETASDDWLADFNNDGVAEMAVGRLPVRTKVEADQVVSKITGYKSAEAQQQVLMVVDKNNANDGFSFAQTGTELGSLLPSSVSMSTINRANINDDAALHTQIVNSINQWPLMVNYIGHGSVEVWTGAPILSTSDVGALNNSNHLPVFVMMTCLNGYFPNPARDSLAESLLRTNSSGAVAVWASSGMTEPNAQSQMNKRLYQQIFNTDGMTLGEAVQKAKESTGDMDVRRTWILFGDPTMRIR